MLPLYAHSSTTSTEIAFILRLFLGGQARLLFRQVVTDNGSPKQIEKGDAGGR